MYFFNHVKRNYPLKRSSLLYGTNTQIVFYYFYDIHSHLIPRDTQYSSTMRNLNAFPCNLTPSDQSFLHKLYRSSQLPSSDLGLPPVRIWLELAYTGLPGAPLKQGFKGGSPMSRLSLSYEAFCLKDNIYGKS